LLDGTPLAGVGALAALAAGVTGSLHCALMCGPLACAPLPRAGAARGAAIVAWQLGRVASYAVVGLALGLAGSGLARLLAERVQPVLPWLMAAGLAASAFEFSRRLPAWAGLGGLGRGVARLGARGSLLARAAALGAATPLLPCGLLWGMFLVAIGAGSPAGGALVLAAFALGGVPGLAAVQLGAAWTGRYPRVERVLRVAVPLVAAAALVARTLHAGDPGAGGGAPHHH
jgi:sulfite exporter TauE/SafE